MAEPLRSIVDPGWADALEPVAGRIAAMGDFLRAEVAAGRRYLPAGENVLRAFKQPFADVRVLIVGQDPYPTPGHAVGLSFSVAPEVRRLPGSLVNIFREYSEDLGYPTPTTGDLTPWAERGVLLLNRVLTVQPGKPGSHRGKGWEEVTEQAIRALAARKPAAAGGQVGPAAAGGQVGPAAAGGQVGPATAGGQVGPAAAGGQVGPAAAGGQVGKAGRVGGEPLVAILWGRDARTLVPLLKGIPAVESAHPSPYSAANGFFGSRPFSRANHLLEQEGAQPVDWKLP